MAVRVCGFVFVLFAVSGNLSMYAADFAPADHGGGNLTLADGDRIWGAHTGINTFTIPINQSIHVREFDPAVSGSGFVEIEANNIVIHGTLDASGAGQRGGGGGGGGGGKAVHSSGPSNDGSPGDGGLSSAGGANGTSGTSGGLGGNGGTGGGTHGGSGGSGATSLMTMEDLNGASGMNGGYTQPAINGDTSVDQSLAMGSGGGGGGGGMGGMLADTTAPDAAGGGGGGGAAGGSGGGYIKLIGQQQVLIDGSVITRGTLGEHGRNGQWGTVGGSSVGGTGGDGGSATMVGTGSPGLPGGGSEVGGRGGAGGSGAGGGILISCPQSGGVALQNSLLDARGGGSSVVNGGTIKIFANGGQLLNGANVRAGRIMVNSGGSLLDVQPPFYETGEGIKAASLLSGTTNRVLINWHRALDNFSAQSAIQYDIYFAENPADVFVSPPIATIAGDTQTVTSGLPMRGEPSFFGVRARDEAGNVETNHVVVQGPTLGQKIDTQPPYYPGAAGIISATLVPATNYHVHATWNEAADNLTPTDRIIYEVYAGTNPQTIFGQAPVMTVVGVTEAVITTLPILNRVFYFGVRAKDEYENRELNKVVIQGPFIGERTDFEPPTYASAQGIISAELMPGSREQILVKWNEASDNLTAQNRIIYGIYRGVDPDSVFSGDPVAMYTGLTEAVIEGLAEPGEIYYLGVRARDEQGNQETNNMVVQGPVIADPLDTDPPYYPYDEAIISATAFPLGDNWVLVTWNVALDDTTAPEQIIYEIYADHDEEQVFSGQPVATMTGATETVVDSLPADGQSYYFGVRARDEAGNREMNTKAVKGP